MTTPPPSWFHLRGIPRCSSVGPEMEDLAWCYVTAQARNGDTWQEITPEEVMILLDPSEYSFSRHWLAEAARGVGMGSLWFSEISLRLRDADGAFDIGGLRWSRQAWLDHCAR